MPRLRVIDFETTGMAPPAEVCEVGFQDFDVELRERVGCPTGWLCRVAAMPPEARAVHHIRLSHTHGFRPFDPKAIVDDAVEDGIEGFVAHMASFEAQWLTEFRVLPLVCTYKAALRVWPNAPTHSNFGLLYWMEDQGWLAVPSDCSPAHRAQPDAVATSLILGALYNDGVTGKDLVRWTREPACLPRCPIGDHRDKPWADVPEGFLRWMATKEGLDPDHRWNASRELDRRDGKLL